jgi:polyphosphate kinase
MVEPKAKDRFLNREWSWLRFNERVLEEAEDDSLPLLERLKFLAIFASNLDEFFMVRVAGLYRQIEAGIEQSGADDRSPRRQLEGVSEIVRELVPRQERALARTLELLGAQGVRLARVLDLEPEGRSFAGRYYDEVVYPVITPMIVGPAHPFPALQNGTLYLVLRLTRLKQKGDKAGARPSRKLRIGFLGLPKVLPRFLGLARPRGGLDLVPMESILGAGLEGLFRGYRIHSVNAVRVTRDADIVLDEEATEDLRRAIAKKLLGRRHGAAVRLEVGSALEPEVLSVLRAKLEVDDLEVYPQSGLMQVSDLFQLYEQVQRPDLKYAPLVPLPAVRQRPRSAFEWLRKGPRLLHHPYHAFDPVAELVSEAADDPAVLAIKQTLYRTSGQSPVVLALTRAAEKGKQVTAVIELRARFDEERNIEWAKRLEQAGAHVVYGLVGVKTHLKALLVVRREETGIKRYVHFGTGNYNDATARVYTDLGLLADDDLLGEDASALFNVITGATQPPPWNKVEMAPTGLRRRVLSFIEREIDRSAKRSRGRIVAKMNSLVDRQVIEALYAASRAGVRVDLIVRGICCLRPGVAGLSENIQVRSIVGRFLEHARIFWLRNGGQEEMYLSSADWMPRNLDNRLELLFPVEDPGHRAYLQRVLELQLRDNVKARELQPTGLYRPARGGATRVESQQATYDLTRARLEAGEG